MTPRSTRRLSAWRAARTQEVLDQTDSLHSIRSYLGERRLPHIVATRETWNIPSRRHCSAILGGGQLGRMTAMAARTMGYRVRVLDPEPACPASFVADETIVGRWDDVTAARRLARARMRSLSRSSRSASMHSLKWLALRRCVPVSSPSASSRTRLCKNHGSQTTDFPSGLFAWCAAKQNCIEAVHALGGNVFLKIGRGGYDGRGQARIGMDSKPNDATIAEAWRRLAHGLP